MLMMRVKWLVSELPLRYFDGKKDSNNDKINMENLFVSDLYHELEMNAVFIANSVSFFARLLLGYRS